MGCQKTQTNEPAHGVTQDQRLIEIAPIHHREHVFGHAVMAIGGRIMGFAAVAVAAAIHCHDTKARFAEGAFPGVTQGNGPNQRGGSVRRVTDCEDNFLA